jgi:hypothetical protein
MNSPANLTPREELDALATAYFGTTRYQKDLANLLQVDKMTVWKWRNGKTERIPHMAIVALRALIQLKRFNAQKQELTRAVGQIAGSISRF